MPDGNRGANNGTAADVSDRLFGMFRCWRDGQHFMPFLAGLFSDCVPCFFVAFYTLWPGLVREMP